MLHQVAAFKADDAGAAKEPAAVRQLFTCARGCALTCASVSQAAKGAAADAEAAPERVAVQTATNFKPVVLEAPEKVRVTVVALWRRR